MANICVNCGYPGDMCDCDGITYERLPYSENEYTVPEELVTDIVDEKSAFPDKYAQFGELRRNADPSATNVRVAYMWYVASIRTETARIEDLMDSFRADDFGQVKNVVSNTTDGRKKWELAHNFWTSEVPEKCARLLKIGRYEEAVAVLSGLEVDKGRTDRHYVRPTKAHAVTGMFGDNQAICMDSRRTAVLEPLLKNMLPNDRKDAYAVHGRWRTGSGKSQNAVGCHTEAFWQDKLARNPEEYRVIADEILETLADKSGIPRFEIEHILFNLGGPRAWHPGLMGYLG